MGQSKSVLGGRSRDDDDAEVAKRQVDSEGQSKRRIYELVSMKDGGGILIDLIKQNSDSEQLDKQIADLVSPLLYNQGLGKMVPLSELWRHRFGKPTESGEASGDSHDELMDKNGVSRRLVCWKLDERGFGGESALHICFLLSSSSHMKLAKILLRLFPRLIEDIYTCDEYFGESSLHMAIVNEDVRVVKWLLDHGAFVHERCLGAFFLPADQKDRANYQLRRYMSSPNSSIEPHGMDLEANTFKSLLSNYDGHVYWGEYPLSFAACLGLVDCYKLLMAKGANPNRQDSNGNSTLHMAVISNRIDMFDLCYSSGANLELANKQNLTPLTLAAKLRRVDMFFHILKVKRQVKWIFCNVAFIDVPLAGLDSVDTHNGSCDDNSLLSIVVFGGENEHLKMLDGLMNQLLETKWNTYAKRRFFLWMSEFLIFLVVSLITLALRFKMDVNTGMMINHKTLRNYTETAIVCYVLRYLWISIRRTIKSVGSSGLLKTLARAPEISLFISTCLLILICIPLRWTNLNGLEDSIVAFIAFISPFKLLFFCRASQRIGSFVVMIYKIVVNDVLCFVVFLVIFVAGFSQSFLIIFKTHRSQESKQPTNETTMNNNYFNNLFDGIISMHMMALNEFTSVYDEFEATEYPHLARILFCFYMIIASILLINMLIAMLGKTYQDITSQPNESVRQWARAILTVERMWTKEERLKMLEGYSSVRNSTDGSSRQFGTTLPLNDKDRQEIDYMDSLAKDNNVNALRLSKLDERLRFGDHHKHVHK